ncbi:MAG TPA: glycosyltransferase [Polyangiaceae bacterium]
MIPKTLHFIWFGETFPWLNALAIASAAECGGFERIVLHTDCPPEVILRNPGLRRLSLLEVRPIDVSASARFAGRDVDRIHDLYAAMTSPAARSDVLRALILAGEGGVYLDMDTVTVASFVPLLERSAAFVGQERICFPNWTFERPELAGVVRACLLSAARYVLASAPHGYRAFGSIARHYALSVNNAVLGCEAHHPFIEAYLSAMLELPAERAARRYAVGPHLLARVCRRFDDQEGCLALLPSSVFYPLPPVISEHWWRSVRQPALADVISNDTLVVHWYASVRSKRLARQVDAEYVRSRQDRQLFSRLAARYLHAV